MCIFNGVCFIRNVSSIITHAHSEEDIFIHTKLFKSEQTKCKYLFNQNIFIVLYFDARA